MESQLIIKLLAFLSLAIVASHAVTLGAADAISYWKSELPNTAMPQAIKDSLSQTAGWVEEKGTSVGVGKGGVNVNTGKGKPGGGTRVNVGHGGVGVHAGAPGHRTNVGVGKGGVYVRTPGKHGKPVVVNVKPGSPFLYQYAATEDQLHDDPNVALFFKPTALHKGNTMTLHFTKTANDVATFLPRSEAEKIPFSSQKMSQILNQFSIAPDSEEAQVMKQTITECEEPVIKGEEKQCATSLESMVDFSKSKLGKKVRAISTAAGGQTSMQKYTISGVQKIQNNDKAVVCHKQNYAYAVFYCHKTQTTKAYTVSLVGANGAKVKAAVVCHKDTSAWNPKHLAFQVLKIKPGTVPVCHFLPEDHIVWVAN